MESKSDTPLLRRTNANSEASSGASPGASSKAGAENGLRTRQLWLTAAIILLALWIAGPFLTPIAWAAVLAIAEWPLYERAVRKCPSHPMPVAIGFVAANGLFVILPISLIASSLAAEGQIAVDWLQQAQQSGVPEPAWIGGIPLLGERLSEWWQHNASSPAAARQFLASINAGSAFSWGTAIASEVAKDTGLFLVTLIMLGGLLARGGQVADQTQQAVAAMFGSFGEDFLLRLTQAVRRTVAGTLLVSVLEGAIIGTAYSIAGVPQAMMFAVATVVLALVPFGAWVVFGLAGLVLIGQQHVWAGILLILFGVTVMTVGDNFVQPAVIGGAAKLPFLLAFVGAFGGLAVMGLVGLFIGPVIMVALVLIWREWSATALPAKA
jgi:predicted PurR-regulated permease PerM